MKRIALLIAMSMAAACGGGVDSAADPTQNEGQLTAAAGFPGEMGKCQVSVDHTRLTGTCLEPAYCDFYQRSNPDCLNRTPRGPFVRDQNCQGIPIDLGSPCRYQASP